MLILVGGRLSETRTNIIHINHTSDFKLLSDYYSIADVFVSTTQSDNLPLVLIKAQICGIPVVGFGHGRTPEEITDKSVKMVGTDSDVNKLLNAIKYLIEKNHLKRRYYIIR